MKNNTFAVPDGKNIGNWLTFWVEREPSVQMKVRHGKITASAWPCDVSIEGEHGGWFVNAGVFSVGPLSTDSADRLCIFLRSEFLAAGVEWHLPA